MGILPSDGSAEDTCPLACRRVSRRSEKRSPMSVPLPAYVRWLLVAVCVGVAAAQAESAGKIDRHAVVTRNNPHLTTMDPWAPLSVGNGEFCFTADVTGLQTFGDYYHQNGIGLETQARWSWHENENPNNYRLRDANRSFTSYGKTIGYPTNQSGPAGMWLRENPQDLPLPIVALDL